MVAYRAILMFGPPGSGKGTQGKALGSLPGFFHLSCGDVFRSIDPRTAAGAAFREYSTQGKLVPDDITVKIWEEQLGNLIASRKFKPERDRLVLDGIPRNVSQAHLLAGLLDVEQVFHLTGVTDETIHSRLKNRALKENRNDDANGTVVRQRLSVFQAETTALLDYYPSPLITSVDAAQPAHIVLSEILCALIAQDWAGTAF